MTEADAKKYCFKCGDKDHLADVCPLKAKINDYIKSLKNATGHTAVLPDSESLHSSQIVL